MYTGLSFCSFLHFLLFFSFHVFHIINWLVGREVFLVRLFVGGGYGILLDRVVKKRISREWAYRGFKETGRDKKMNWVRSGYYVGLMMASVVCIIMGVQFLPK